MEDVLQNGRATISTFGNQLEIYIPTKKSVFNILFVGVWLVGWYFGEMSALTQVLNGGIHGFLIIWLCLWTFAGACTIFNLLTEVAGSETTTLQGEYLQIKKAIFGIGIIREYKLTNISNFRIASDQQSSSFFRRRNWTSFGSGPIYFDYGMKTVKFGLDIDEAEAKHILQRFQDQGYMKKSV